MSGNTTKNAPVSTATAVETMTLERRLAANAYQAWVRGILDTQVLDQSADDGAFDEYRHGWYDGRYTALMIPRLVAARLWSDLIDADHARIEQAAERAMTFVVRRQLPDGRLDLGGAFSSNEAGFPIPGLAKVYSRLRPRNDEWAQRMVRLMDVYFRRTAEALLAGEAHTANHRWAAAAGPLACLYRLHGDPRYLHKIESYLADGVDCDEDGCWYEERSPGYNNVANHGMIVLADALDRPELLNHVVRNLRFMLFMVQPNGEADASYSFRQDRHCAGANPCDYNIARRAALVSGDGRLATLAQRDGIHAPRGNDLFPLLLSLDDHPGPLPPAQPLPDTYDRWFPRIQLQRKRWSQTALTLSADRGAHFFDSVRDRWGGIRRSEDWFQLFHGDVVIASLQLAVAQMRNIQPVQLRGLEPGRFELEGDSEGWVHELHFRPGRPRVRMAWDLSHRILVEVAERRIDVRIQAQTPNAVPAAIKFWVRPEVRIEGQDTVLTAGEHRLLPEGPVVRLVGKTHVVEITGLPPAAHHWTLHSEPAIPTSLPTQAACLYRGLRLPVDVTLTFHLK